MSKLSVAVSLLTVFFLLKLGHGRQVRSVQNDLHNMIDDQAEKPPSGYVKDQSLKFHAHKKIESEKLFKTKTKEEFEDKKEEIVIDEEDDENQEIVQLISRTTSKKTELTEDNEEYSDADSYNIESILGDTDSNKEQTYESKKTHIDLFEDDYYDDFQRKTIIGDTGETEYVEEETVTNEVDGTNYEYYSEENEVNQKLPRDEDVDEPPIPQEEEE